MSQNTPSSAQGPQWAFLSGNGEMAELTRTRDWSAHPLGSLEAWPPTLKAILGTALSNRFPMFIFWGAEHYCFYNDAYRPSLGKDGKHPSILGMRAHDAWPEIWAVIHPLIQQVMTGGGGTWSEDQLIPIYRNGHMEDVYWTFSYSPITDAEGIQGVLVTCVETTGMVKAVNELKESELALRTSEQRYQSFMQQSSEGIWRCELAEPMPVSLPMEEALDWVYLHGYMAECNDAMARMYGYTRGEELIGAKLGDLMPRSPDNEIYISAFMAAGFSLLGGESEEVDKDGNTIYFSNNLVGIVENDQLVRAWGTQLEITERKRAEQALRDADRRKDEFLATLAHELRNPLSPLVTGLELLASDGMGADPEQRGRTHAMMDRQLKQMVRLVNDLMDVSRISRGKVSLRTEPMELADVLDMAVESSRSFIADAGHKLELFITRKPLLLEGDPVRLTQVFLNVLNNAAKYTRAGGFIRLRAERDGEHAVVSIEDNGIGLTPEQATSIFEMFRQVDGGPEHYKDGLGIGLSLVKQLVEMHGGSVEAESAGLGKGTTMRIRLPLITTAYGKEPNREMSFGKS